MSLQTFTKILLRNWWIIALLVIVSAASTAFFVSRQKPVYEASAMLELRPSNELTKPEQVINVYSLLDKRTTINTLARKATSSSMQETVAQKLNISSKDVISSDVNAVVSPEANLIEVSASSANPVLAADICNMVANQLIGEALGRVLQIDLIDPAVAPTAPAGQEKSRVIVLGAVSGLVLGIIFAMLENFLRTMRETSAANSKRQLGLAGAMSARNSGANDQ